MLAESTRLSREPVREALSGMRTLFASQMGTAPDAGAIGLLARQVFIQAQTMTYADIYWLLAVSTGLSLLLVPMIRRTAGAVSVAGH
jgi:DHA2 family multidrug resistance protein